MEGYDERNLVGRGLSGTVALHDCRATAPARVASFNVTDSTTCDHI